MVCAYNYYRSVGGCVYSTIIVCIIIYIQYKLLDVLDLLLFVALYTYRLNYYVLLPYSYWEIVKIQTHLRDVQGLGVDNLGPPVSLLLTL